MSKRAPLTPDDPRHGTTAGFRAHAAVGERPCRPCRDAKNAYDRANRRPQQDYTKSGYDPNDGLPAGRWMRDTWGVLVFVEIPEPAPAPKPVKVNVALLVACPKCGVKVTQACRTAAGKTTNPHAARLVERRCDCGTPVGAYKQLCEPCRRRSRAASQREFNRRARGTSEVAA